MLPVRGAADTVSVYQRCLAGAGARMQLSFPAWPTTAKLPLSAAGRSCEERMCSCAAQRTSPAGQQQTLCPHPDMRSCLR